MPNHFNTRLINLLQALGINTNRFGSELGYSNSEKIRRLVKEKDTKPSFQILQDIAKRYPEVNMRWLLTGDGHMFTENENQTNNKDLTDYIKTLEKDCEICKEKEKRIGAMEKQISTLEEMVEVLRGR